MKVIVTGGAGFIGSHLVDALVKKGHQVTVVDNLSSGNIDNLSQSRDKIKFVKFDLREGYPKIKEADFIFHLAALPRVQMSVDDPYESYQSNVTVLMNSLELARKLKVKRFLSASSSSVSGDQKKQPIDEKVSFNPQNPYGYYKMIGEELCQMYQRVYGIPSIAYRFFNVYGSRMSTNGAYKLVFGVWIDQIRKNEKLTITGDGKQTRDFTFVSDIAEGLIAGINPKNVKDFEVINLGGGNDTSINDLAKLFGYPSVHIPERAFEDRKKRADISKARENLGWIPKIGIEEGIKILKKEYKLP